MTLTTLGVIPKCLIKYSFIHDSFMNTENIKIVNESTVEEPDYYLLLSWNFAEEFYKNKEFIKGKRKFILPIPEPKIVTA